MQKYLCIGHAAYDITLPINSYPQENTKMRIPNQIECGGGSAANAAYLLSKWKMDASFMGIVGDDLYGERIQEEFLQIGTNVKYLQKTKEFHTSVSYILANQENGTRTIITNRDKKIEIQDLEISFVPDVVLIDGEEMTISKKILLENPNCISILDAGSVTPSIVELGKYVKYFICSKDFAEEYTQLKIDFEDLNTLSNIYQLLKEKFQTAIIITLGENGSCTEIDGQLLIVPTLNVNRALDSTAAGDIFHGAFAYFISNGYDLYRTLRLANITGALSVMKLGGKNSMPDLDKVLELENYGLS